MHWWQAVTWVRTLYIKVTIMPRGWALGVTWQLPEQDAINNYKR